MESFLDYFEELEDPRIDRRKPYPMDGILLLSLCAAVCGAEGWLDVESFGHGKLSFLWKYLPFANGIPSDDTTGRFCRSIDADCFQRCFLRWAKDIRDLPEARQIAIDGKTNRGSRDGDRQALHVTGAFCSEARIVLGRTGVKEKSNEISAIPKLLEWLDLRGALVSIDAMGCQRNIADRILSRGGNYLLALKGNQGSLHEDVKDFFVREDSSKVASIHTAETLDKGHGRIESRCCKVTQDIDWLQRDRAWPGLKSIATIRNTREIDGRVSCEVRYYIGSVEADPDKILQSVRSHWSIENRLHWVLDMSFGEDRSRIRKGNAPENMAVLRHFSLNLMQQAKTKRQSIKRLRKMAGWNDKILDNILSQDKF